MQGRLAHLPASEWWFQGSEFLVWLFKYGYCDPPSAALKYLNLQIEAHNIIPIEPEGSGRYRFA